MYWSVYVSVSVWAHAMWVQIPEERRRESKNSGDGVAAGCELPDMGAEDQNWISGGAEVPLSNEPPSQTHAPRIFISSGETLNSILKNLMNL